MARITLDYKQVVKEFPELKNLELDGSNDFNKIAEVIGSRNPNHVWPIRDCLAKGERQAASPKLARLFSQG